jgi:ComF family protein
MRMSIVRIKSLFRPILDFFLPTRCLMCGVFTQIPSTTENLSQPSLCSGCWQQLSFITEPCCNTCAAPLSFDGEGCRSCQEKVFEFDSARAALVYNDAAKKLITRFKHSGQTGYVQLFTPWMQTGMANHTEDYDGIIPVPLHFWRLFKRGYNQAALLAHGIRINEKSKYDNEFVPILKGALKRVRHTPSQGHRSAPDRVKNLKNALRADATLVSGKRLLLVDDVMTTGATLNECARNLKEAGATRVDVLVLARAVKAV